MDIRHAGNGRVLLHRILQRVLSVLRADLPDQLHPCRPAVRGAYRGPGFPHRPKQFPTQVHPDHDAHVLGHRGVLYRGHPEDQAEVLSFCRLSR